MPKLAKELTVRAVAQLKEPGSHAVGGCPGLLLQVQPTGSRSWTLRVMSDGARRKIGLGAFPAVSLTEARTAGRAIHEDIRQGVEPVAPRKAKVQAAKQEEAAQGMTFAECAKQYIASHAAAWSNAKHAQQWTNTIETYCGPIIGAMDVADVDTALVLRVLQQDTAGKETPFWHTKTETASRLRGRMEKILDWARVAGHRRGENPARLKGHLDALLPPAKKIMKRRHHPALAYPRMAEFMAALRARDGVSARALEFAILNASRSGEVRGALWSEFDLKARIWTIPGERMKAGKEHRVPLSDAAMALLESLPRVEGNPLVFSGPRSGQPLSDMTLTAITRRMDFRDAREQVVTPHGFRSSFRDWSAEETHYSRDVCEMALAHTIGDRVEAAYRRGDLFDKRRALMTDWAAYCEPAETTPKKRPAREAGITHVS